ncbi:hypothetical protein B0T22DRAFT_469266 [Podospora appendiculata]|uniref:Uncharacterized protein n=1 Tax=Podospora appendiculata TaxID=314037 RepID=A0AAE0X340_9PEZI|nr:hypothetical protein B0T22DRAFT_469266 [Podospora appendiculata]
MKWSGWGVQPWRGAAFTTAIQVSTTGCFGAFPSQVGRDDYTLHAQRRADHANEASSLRVSGQIRWMRLHPPLSSTNQPAVARLDFHPNPK